jgi:hypothetical protein
MQFFFFNTFIRKLNSIFVFLLHSNFVIVVVVVIYIYIYIYIYIPLYKIVMAIMVMVHVPSLVVTKSSTTYHHQLGKRTTIGGGSIGTQSLRTVVK